MDSAAMNSIAAALATVGLRVARFKFAYMAARREGDRKPPLRAETLVPEFDAAIGELVGAGRLIIGGKSMGGRVASLTADDHFRQKRIAGLLCFGYPFHPPGKPEQLRTAHLEALITPTLICQGHPRSAGIAGRGQRIHSFSGDQRSARPCSAEGPPWLLPRRGGLKFWSGWTQQCYTRFAGGRSASQPSRLPPQRRYLRAMPPPSQLAPRNATSTPTAPLSPA